MTILEVIEKLRKDYGSTGYSAIFRYWYSEYMNNNFSLSYRTKIIGFLYGLSATGYLSDEEVDTLIDSL